MNDLKQVSRTLTPVQKVLHDSGHQEGIRPIDELNTGLVALKEELMEDELAIKRVELSLITFGPVKIVTDFQSPDLFYPPRLNAEGDTPMGAAIEKGIEVIRDRKVAYRQNGISYYRPWIFLISDGEPTDRWGHAADLVRAGEQSKAFAFFAVGVEGANFDILTKISVRRPLRLDGLRFREMFMWLSSSLGSVSRSTPGDDVPLENPALPEGWAAI